MIQIIESADTLSSVEDFVASLNDAMIMRQFGRGSIRSGQGYRTSAPNPGSFQRQTGSVGMVTARGALPPRRGNHR
jgi:hypothetical protein